MFSTNFPKTDFDKLQYLIKVILTKSEETDQCRVMQNVAGSNPTSIT